MAEVQMLDSWQAQIRPEHTALVLVDLQNDFVHPGGWVAEQQIPGYLGDTGITVVLARAAALLDAARAANVQTVFVRMLGDEKYLSPPMRAQYLRNHTHPRPTCVQEGTWGADFYGNLRPNGQGLEFLIDKHRYSACIGTRLDQVLRSNGIKTIVVSGVATSGCVESTIRDAFMLDYYVVTAGDACGDYDQDRHRATLTKMDLSFGYVISVADVERAWTPQLPPVAGSYVGLSKGDVESNGDQVKSTGQSTSRPRT
jgi:ureidoacrylate peracid hydrolase